MFSNNVDFTKFLSPHCKPQFHVIFPFFRKIETAKTEDSPTVEKSASPIPKSQEVQKSDTKQEIIENDNDEEDIPLKKFVKSKMAHSPKKTPSNANTPDSARPKRSRKVPKKLQDEDAFPEYDALDFEHQAIADSFD